MLPDTRDTHSYYIDAGNEGAEGQAVFSMDLTTGFLRVAYPIDYEGGDPTSYFLLLRIVDDGTPPLSDSITLNVRIQDRNDAPILAGSSSIVVCAPTSPPSSLSPSSCWIHTLTGTGADASWDVGSQTGCVGPRCG